jgi:hypothetical protein
MLVSRERQTTNPDRQQPPGTREAQAEGNNPPPAQQGMARYEHRAGLVSFSYPESWQIGQPPQQLGITWRAYDPSSLMGMDVIEVPKATTANAAIRAVAQAFARYQYGDHPDVLWRDLKQMFAKYALDKFDLQKNDIERTAVAEISAHAFTHVRSDGTRGIEIPKEFRFVSNNGREWIFDFTSQRSPDAPILTQTSRIILPEEAKNARLDQPGTGSEQLVYDMAENFGFGRTLLGLGLLSIAGGILFGIFALIFLLKRPATPPVAPAQ